MKKLLATIATVTLSILPAGCNIVGPAYVLIAGPEKNSAAYELPKDRPAVVFVDDRLNRLDRRSLRNVIAAKATEELLKSGAVKTVIDPKAALVRVSGEAADAPTDIASLGASVGAEVIIYATVDEFTLSPDQSTFQPTATVRVKVIDCVNKPARLFPTEDKENGQALTVTLPYKQGQAPKNGGEYNLAQDRLAGELGERIAKLFFKHEVKDRVSELNDRK